MDSKNSQRLSDKENIPKTKGKEKARKELWDSLCAIYENEAHKDNAESEMEEVDVSVLEKWTMTNPDTSMRGLTQLTLANPQLLSAAAVPGAGDTNLILKLELEEQREADRIKKRKYVKRDSETSKKCRCNSSLNMKTKKSYSPVKKYKIPKSSSQVNKLNLSLMKKNINEKDSTKLQKNVLKENNSEKCFEKIKGKQKLVHLKDHKESDKHLKATKIGTERKNLQLETQRTKHESHKCSLEYRPYLKTRHNNSRSDKRIFKCQLVFRVCHCFESDIVL